MKLRILLMTLFVGISTLGFGQDTLNNLGLEEWTSSDSGLFEQPNFPWKTANSSVDFTGGVPVNPVEKVTDAYTGDYAAKMESATIFFTFTAGALWTGDFEINFQDPASSAKFGVPFEGRPTNVQFYYKYFPVNGDSMGIYTILRRWNPDTQQQDTIAYQEVRQTETTSEYTLFDLELEYFIDDLQPDSIEIAFTSSADGINYMGQVGSQLFVDDVKLVDTEVGIINVLMPEIHVTAFPNPAHEQLSFRLDKAVPNGELRIYDMSGKLVHTTKIQDKTTNLEVLTWQSGMYHFLLKNADGHDVSSGKFVIHRE